MQKQKREYSGISGAIFLLFQYPIEKKTDKLK